MSRHVDREELGELQICKDVTCILHDVLSVAQRFKMESLPEEMLFSIFRNLDPLELVSLSRVNRRWRKVALSPQLHRFYNDLCGLLFIGRRNLFTKLINLSLLVVVNIKS